MTSAKRCLMLMLSVIMLKVFYAECRYDECHYAECRGAVIAQWFLMNKLGHSGLYLYIFICLWLIYTVAKSVVI
jgi:hypothetical protein